MNNKTTLLIIVIIIFGIKSEAQVPANFTDARDSKQYKSVKIGTQTWMAENLAFKAGSGCYAYGNDEKNVKSYGYMYTWETSRKVCPAGWHLPSSDEWTTMLTFLGGKSVAGDKIKEAGTEHWQKPVSPSTNVSGFTALPGGYRNESGEYYVLGYNGWWWCSNEEEKERAYHILIFGHVKDVTISYINKIDGFSVRCVKD